MRKVKWLAACTSVFLIAAAGMAGTSPALASDGNTIEEYIDENNILVADDAVFDSSTVFVVDKNGNVVTSFGDEVMRGSPSPEARSGCSYRNAVFVNYSGWQNTVDGCSFIGWDSTATWPYSWAQDTFAWNSGPSCMQGRGYYPTGPRWFNAGCGGGGSVNALIGNVASVAKMRGHATAPPTIGYVRWR